MTFTEQWAADIRRDRALFIADAVHALADLPADVVRGAAFLAGLRWDSEHPTYTPLEEAP